MATRRSRLQIKPNIGPKITKTPAKTPVNVPKASETEKSETDKLVTVLKDKTVPLLQNSNNSEIKSTEELQEKIAINSPSRDVSETEPVKNSVNKSPTPAENAVKPLFKPDPGPLARGIRNRFAKPKPNIGLRGVARPNSAKPTSPVKVFSPERSPIKSPIKSPVRLSLSNEDSSTQQSSISCVDTCEQDENSPVVNVDQTISTSTIDKRSTQQKTEKIKTSRRQRAINIRQFPEDEPPDRQKMKMSDLIYWNPSKNPMKQSSEKIRKRSNSITVESSSTSDNVDNSFTTEPDKQDDSSMSSDAMLVPQVTIGPDGSMIINEQSLVVEAEHEKEVLSPTEIVEEDDVYVNYNSFRNKGTTKCWLDNETARFYRALSALGTDFSLMSSLFPHRTRRELKNKFKREERYNRQMVDMAIKMRTPLSLESFESIESVLEKDKHERENKRKASIKRKKEEKQASNPEYKPKKSRPTKEIKNTKKSVEEEEAVASSPEANNNKTSRPSRPKKPKITKEKTTPDKLSIKRQDGDQVQPEIIRKSKPLEYEEFEFESSDEEDKLPARLPKLQKSSKFTEFQNTASKKLQVICASRPVSDDSDDDDNEDDDVDVLASDSDIDEDVTSNSNIAINHTQENVTSNLNIVIDHTQENVMSNSNIVIDHTQENVTPYSNIVIDDTQENDLTNANNDLLESAGENTPINDSSEILNSENIEENLCNITEDINNSSGYMTFNNVEGETNFDVTDDILPVENQPEGNVPVVENETPSPIVVTTPEDDVPMTKIKQKSEKLVENKTKLTSDNIQANTDFKKSPINKSKTTISNVEHTTSTTSSTTTGKNQTSKTVPRRIKKFQPNLNLARKKDASPVGNVKNLPVSSGAVAKEQEKGELPDIFALA
ncbi:histone-lysine N-methyltransferase, H3 lysine-79 specific [Patella vulgata]|uniref:histone-lysine N-methyltransferase, H3 lysine-79 specific n=1 Tax=Patella vulgata TaxID=6465 RepID=UPI0024A8E85D|nr:histone-lysine N-methyltransferase, H3 lysine-79 specific [Patella vulgata]